MLYPKTAIKIVNVALQLYVVFFNDEDKNFIFYIT